MDNVKSEIGYSCDIALERLLALYATSSEFKRYCHNLNTQPEITQYRQKKLKRGRRGEPVISGLIKNRDNYSRLTKKWKNEWQELTRHISEVTKLRFEEAAENWGLRCEWGCGFIFNSSIILHPLRDNITYGTSENKRTIQMNLSDPFFISPGPPDSVTRLKTDISIYDTKDSIKQKAKDLKKRAKEFLEITRKRLDCVEYRGFEKQQKKDIGTKVQWLFWHITPPYLSATEISIEWDDKEKEFVNEVYIRRCYRDAATLLGIKVSRGWTKGRKRALQQDRAAVRQDLLSTKSVNKYNH